MNFTASFPRLSVMVNSDNKETLHEKENNKLLEDEEVLDNVLK